MTDELKNEIGRELVECDKAWDICADKYRARKFILGEDQKSNYMTLEKNGVRYDVDAILRDIWEGFQFPEPKDGIDHKMGTLGFLLMIPAKYEILTSKEALLEQLRHHVTGAKGEPAEFSIWEDRYSNTVINIFERL